MSDEREQEPRIAINGVELTFAEAMTLRVALQSFLLSLSAEGLGGDEHGRVMSANYQAHGAAIERLMLPVVKTKP